jgi:hypothetical protein
MHIWKKRASVTDESLGAPRVRGGEVLPNVCVESHLHELLSITTQSHNE